MEQVIPEETPSSISLVIQLTLDLSMDQNSQIYITHCCPTVLAKRRGPKVEPSTHPQPDILKRFVGYSV